MLIVLDRKMPGYTQKDLEHYLALFIKESRFTFEIDVTSPGRTIKLREIRLKTKKPYCGSHPAACDIDARRMTATYLEGADWVDFNDSLNDILDKANLWANVRSAVCIVRKGAMRRTHYGYYMLNMNQGQWNRDEDDMHYRDYCGQKAPASSYPFGTPGSYERVW